MAEQHQQRHDGRQQEEDEQPTDVPAGANPEELKGELDNLLDEIDSVLEENAEEFTQNYVQKGGE